MKILLSEFSGFPPPQEPTFQNSNSTRQQSPQLVGNFYPAIRYKLFFSPGELGRWGGGGGGSFYNGLYQEAPPKSGTFFRMEVYKRAGISRAEEKGRENCHLGFKGAFPIS